MEEFDSIGKYFDKLRAFGLGIAKYRYPIPKNVIIPMVGKYFDSLLYPEYSFKPKIRGKHYDQIIIDDYAAVDSGLTKDAYRNSIEMFTRDIDNIIFEKYLLPSYPSDELTEDDMYKDSDACNATGNASYPPPGRQNDEQYALQQEFETARSDAARVSNLYSALNEFSHIYQGTKSALTPSQKREFRKLVEKMLDT